MTSSLTTALEEMNEQLRRENDALKTEIDMVKDELKVNNDKITQLITLVNKMAVNNENQMQRINSQTSKNLQLRTEVRQLKVSQCGRKLINCIINIYHNDFNANHCLYARSS